MSKIGCVQHDCAKCRELRTLAEKSALDLHTYATCLPPDVAARFSAIVRLIAAFGNYGP